MSISRSTTPQMHEDMDAVVPNQSGPSHPRYKTEMCKNFKATGTCTYSDSCQFAHCVSELKVQNRHSKYKTSMCKSWRETGECPYGSRCLFVHDETPSQIMAMQQKIANEQAQQKRKQGKEEGSKPRKISKSQPPVQPSRLQSPPLEVDASMFFSTDLPLRTPSLHGSMDNESMGSLKSGEGEVFLKSMEMEPYVQERDALINYDESVFLDHHSFFNQSAGSSKLQSVFSQAAQHQLPAGSPVHFMDEGVCVPASYSAESYKSEAEVASAEQPPMMRMFGFSNKLESATCDLWNQKN